jgi:hypothetical protein
MASKTIDRLIINSPYEEPQEHWRYDRERLGFDLAPGRRPAGYVAASPDSKAFDDPGIFVEIPLVNQIRPRVRAWRDSGYPGTTEITRRLLRHWRDPEDFETRRFFFCQLEAIETLIWLAEADPSERVGIDIPGHQGVRLPPQLGRRRPLPTRRRWWRLGHRISQAAAGAWSQVRLSSVRPARFLCTPPHCLKKNGTPPARQRSRISVAHSACFGLDPGPDSPNCNHPVKAVQLQVWQRAKKRLQ